LAAGAEGYLLKAIHPKDLAAGIRLVHHGGALISKLEVTGRHKAVFKAREQGIIKP
jgi:hypothetical protein